MKKIIMALAIIFIVSVVFTSMVYSQMAGKGWERTITLPSGEVILDMSGEWDDWYEFYGIFSWIPPATNILTITQEGTKFNAVKQIGSVLTPKGSETIKGELDKDGFKEIYTWIKARDGSILIWEPCKWEISENGNKVVLDCGDRAKRTITRR